MKNWLKTEIKKQNQKTLELNENDNTAYSTLRDSRKAVLREKVIKLSTPKKMEKVHTENLMTYLKDPKKKNNNNNNKILEIVDRPKYSSKVPK